MAIEKIIGNSLREFRKERNISIKCLSDKTGFSYGYICNIESGTALPSLEFQRRISKTFKVNFLHIISRIDLENITSKQSKALREYLDEVKKETEKEIEKNETIIKNAVDKAVEKIIKINQYKGLPRQDVEELKEFTEDIIKIRLNQICDR